MVNFIREDPAEEDFFKTHTRLAEAIANTIRLTPDLKVIGLLGRWGSGKSTVAKKVVGILENETDGPFRIFTYDAWLHQSDPIRRSFLETLLSYLVEVGAVRKGTWKPQLKELSGHVEDTQMIEVPELSRDAHWLGASLLPVPIGVGLLGMDTIKEAFGKDATNLGKVSFGIAVWLILMPLWVWLFRYVVRRPWRGLTSSGGASIFAKPFWAIVDEDGSRSQIDR